MRVKVIIVIALAVLLIAPSANAMAGFVSTLDKSQWMTPSERFLAQPVYGQQNINSLEQIDGLVKNSLDISKDMYDNRGNGLLSSSATGIPLMIGQLDEIPGPMELISAMAPAGYANDTSGIGNQNMRIT